ncbi:MAG: class I SAM-dependent methyltransferase family protein [Candidatus Diapherotrites archaeon]|nr:class I SAM-dependent methyltransferase family protein [Candidatus Diapherotrites archaeon]
MVKAVFVRAPKEKAQEVKEKLREKQLLDSRFNVKREGDFILFPVKKAVPGFKTVRAEAHENPVKPRSLKEALAKELSDSEFGKLVNSFDTIGSIAIIEVPPELESKKRLIGRAIIEIHKSIRTVFRKKGGRQGVYRIAPLELIAGENTTETIYKEHGVRMELDVSKTYFSPRLSEERRRIASLVRDGEMIAGLFAGVGPFPLVIARQRKCTAYAVELNPIAFEYLEKNVELNSRVLKGRIIPIHGDVREVARQLPQCDRVLMPLPKGGEDFLDSAFLVCKPGGVIHFYQFAPDSDLYSGALGKIKEAAKRARRRVKVLNKKVVRPYAPRVSQVVIDFEVE